MLESVGLIQIIEAPTRTTQTAATLIDVIGISYLSIIAHSGIVNVHGISDHDLTFCHLQFSIPLLYPQYKIMIYFKFFDYNHYLNNLYQIPFFSIFDLPTVEEKAEFLTLNLLNLLDIHAPIKRLKFTRPPASWLV